MAVPADMEEVVKEFLVESYENLDQLDRDLLTLESDPGSRETLASVFRSIHTIKGTCGFLGFGRLESVAHVGESLLSRLRDGRLELNAEITSALLAMVDAVRRMLGSIEGTGEDGEEDHSALITRLNRLQSALGEIDAETLEGFRAEEVEPGVESVVAVEAAPSVEPGEPLPRQNEPAARALAPDARESEPIARELEPGAAQTTRSPAVQPPAEVASAITDHTVRVDVGLLDKLMNLAGELVLARNQILQFSAAQHDAAFLSASQRLNHITTELQEGVMKTRMQPIGNVWSKLPRMVRDLSVACGKQVHVEMEGRDTELDKTIIEAIKDPLIHVVRNAVDHGIEAPAVRIAAGKPREGRLFLRAYHEGGQVNIEISDDGAGIDPERVRQKALRRGLLSEEQADRLGERDLLGLIFLPGFSTADAVTNISGRGVGMDVVRTNVEKIGGVLDLQSRPGQGTTLKIKLPLTLAIIPALIVTSGGDRYAIPQVSLVELVRLKGGQALAGIEMIHGAPVHRLRGNLLPLVYLDRELAGMQSTGRAIASTTVDDAINIVVLRAGDRHFGLVVTGICDTEEIVVKPLGMQLKDVPVFAGATIMGDGRVALILDVLGLAQQANIVSEMRARPLGDASPRADASADDCGAMLLFATAAGEQAAIPLSLVARLEELPADAIECSGGDEVVQYRGRILPLIRLSRVLDGMPAASPEGHPLHVVVYSEAGRSVGLVVERILDVVAGAAAIERQGARPGVLGSAVIQQRVTRILDVAAIVRAGNRRRGKASKAA
ncbi:MAG TPA: chemotaxis protein CheA [Candidatus Bathyarchaeia archaeon]|nr:chemotaxis protein CheA [Candidatus Bathyarchaeia archaeon]